MKDSKFNQTVYLVEDGELEVMTLEEYLSEHWSNETTSPLGVAPRLHIRNAEGDKVNEFDEGSEYYEIWSWGAGGNHPKRYSREAEFDTAEEAYEAILEEWLHASQTQSTTAPSYFEDKDEAEEWLSEF